MEEVSDVSVDWVQIIQAFVMLLTVFWFAVRVHAAHNDLSEANKVITKYFKDSTIFFLL